MSFHHSCSSWKDTSQLCGVHSESQGGVTRTADQKKIRPPCEHLETAGTRRNSDNSSDQCSCSPMGSGGQSPTVRREVCMCESAGIVIILCWYACSYASHLHTVVTHAAVWAARRSVEVARGTPLHPHLNSLYLHVFIKRSSEIIVFVLVLIRWDWERYRRKFQHSHQHCRCLAVF